MTSVFIVKQSSLEQYYENPVYSNVAAFSTRALADNFMQKAKILQQKNHNIYCHYSKLIREDVKLNPYPPINFPCKPDQRDYNDPNLFSQLMKEYNNRYKIAKDYKETYHANRINARIEAACITSDGKLTPEEIEKFAHSEGVEWEVEELTFLA